MVEGVLIGLIVLFIGWFLTPIGKPFRQSMENWLYKPDAHTNRWLGIVHAEGMPYLQPNTENPIRHGPFLIYGTLYTYRIGIANKGDVTINDVEVKLTSIMVRPNTFNAVGGHLHWMHDNPPDGQPFLTKKSIPPTKQQEWSDAIFVDVLRCFWPDKPEEQSHAQLQICHIVPGVSVMIPLRNYDLVVTANDQQREVVAATLRLTLQESGPPKLTLQT